MEAFLPQREGFLAAELEGKTDEELVSSLKQYLEENEL